MKCSHSQRGTQYMFSPICLTLYSNWPSIWLVMGLSQKVLSFRLNDFFSNEMLFSQDILFLPSSILIQVPLNHLFILLYGLLGNPISCCAIIPQPSISFFFVCSFFICRVSISLHYHWLARHFLHFLTSPFPSYHTPFLGLWPMFSIHIHHISRGL